MKKRIYLFLASLFFVFNSNAQTTAIDFSLDDCDGQPHHLFDELDANKVVVMEFIMTCNSCIIAGHELEEMIASLEVEHPGQTLFYQFAFTNSYSCSTMQTFKTDNGFSSALFDSGAAMVAYYGGFGMPTVAVVAGSNHSVLCTNIGFLPGDTTAVGVSIRNFFNTLGTNNPEFNPQSFTVFPNPAREQLSVGMDLNRSSDLELRLLDLLGNEVFEIIHEAFQAGHIERKLSLESVAPGLYTLQAKINGKTFEKKVSVTE